MANWLHDKDALNERIKNGRPAVHSPATLWLSEIEHIESVFQHRTVSDWASDAHVKALLRALKNTGKAFEPLTVLWAGDGWVLVDGHHRYKAYEQYPYDEPVPVKVFNGTLDEALGEALRANVQDKLTMTAKEKTNAAWRLVIGANFSINQTAALSLASRATVVQMRKVREVLNAKSPGWAGSMDWPTARAKVKGEEIEFSSGGEWLAKKAEMMAEQLRKSFGKELSKYPKALWMALDKYDNNLLYAFCLEHGFDHEVLESRYAVLDDEDLDF